MAANKSNSKSRKRPAPTKAPARETEPDAQVPAADAPVEGGTATPAENAKLEHSVDGVTTRDDLNDAGVTVLPGSPSEPVGPEDALGVGAKRGDYTERIVGNPHESVPLEGGGDAIRDADGNIVDFKPRSKLVAQRPRTEDIGDEAGKGGVPSPAAAIG